MTAVFKVSLFGTCIKGLFYRECLGEPGAVHFHYGFDRIFKQNTPQPQTRSQCRALALKPTEAIFLTALFCRYGKKKKKKEASAAVHTPWCNTGEMPAQDE